MSGLMVVTDLDGSLLDHYTYAWAPAVPMLEMLRTRDVPVVLCSSKTRAEIQALRHQMGVDDPYIVENGAAVYLPRSRWPEPPDGAQDREDDWCVAFGQGREHWQSLLRDLPDDLRLAFRRFSAMSPGQIADLTGLALEDAERAARREYGEPLDWRGSDEQKQRLIEALADAGAQVLEGGRFLHVAGHWNKGRALNWLADHINASAGRPTTVALGDSHNDVAMLEAADYAVVVRSPVHPAPTLSRSERVILTQQTGPRGWVEGLRAVLESMDFE